MSRVITEINIHASATKPQWMAGRPGSEKVAEITRWHVVDNGWSAIGYHYVIDRDGKFYRGRSESLAGAFEPACNARAIGICLIGGYGSAQTDSFEKHYTPEQDATLRRLIKALQDKRPSITRITGHNDYSNKACPGFKVDRWLSRRPSRTFAESGTAAGSGAAAAAGVGLAVVEAVKVVEPAQSTSTAVAREKQFHAPQLDHLHWALIAIIIVGAAYALYRRWRDWQAGRQ